MPNWVTTKWDVTLPSDKVKRFLYHFLSWDSEENVNRSRYLYRTFISDDSINIVDLSNGFSTISFFADSAWSLESILCDRQPDEFGITRCIPLEEVLIDCRVVELTAVGDEPGMGFREFLSYTMDDGLGYDSETITQWCCEECNTFGYWEDYSPGVDRTVCPNCGEKFKEEEDE